MARASTRTSAPAPAKRGPKPRGTLSREIIARAGLALLDRSGVEEFSLRGVAAEVGVRPNAIYTYFPSRLALESGVVDVVLGEARIELLTDEDVDWAQRIQDYALSLREALLRHPGAAPLLLRAPMDGPQALTIAEALMTAFIDAGLSGPDGARAVYPLLVYIVGSVALEMADTPGAHAPLPTEADRIAARKERFTEIDFDAWPGLHSARSVVGRWPSTTQFVWGLERLLHGVIANPSE
jgi:AcrR family transcriptional regulator